MALNRVAHKIGQGGAFIFNKASLVKPYLRRPVQRPLPPALTACDGCACRCRGDGGPISRSARRTDRHQAQLFPRAFLIGACEPSFRRRSLTAAVATVRSAQWACISPMRVTAPFTVPWTSGPACVMVRRFKVVAKATTTQLMDIPPIVGYQEK